MKKVTLLYAVALSAAVVFSVPPTVTAAQHMPAEADNAKKNKEESKEATAGQQKETESDREITRKIRRAVMKDKSLSMKAHNVKIITRDGRVTLKGPVKTDKEKAAIEKAAANVVGKGKVSNELEVAPPKK